MIPLLSRFAQVVNCQSNVDIGANGGGRCLTNIPTVAANQSTLTNFLSILFGVLGAIAVLMIVIQAIMFAISQGDPQKAADARKSIIYAIVGLAVSISAEFIVRLVIGKL